MDALWAVSEQKKQKAINERTGPTDASAINRVVFQRDLRIELVSVSGRSSTRVSIRDAAKVVVLIGEGSRIHWTGYGCIGPNGSAVIKGAWLLARRVPLGDSSSFTSTRRKSDTNDNDVSPYSRKWRRQP